MGTEGESPESQLRYFESLGIPEKIRRPIPLLMHPLTEELVLAALERMPRGSSPGVDGVMTDVYKKFPAIFVPRPLASLQSFFVRGCSARRLVSVPHAVYTKTLWGGGARRLATNLFAEQLHKVGNAGHPAPIRGRSAAVVDRAGAEGVHV